MKNKLINLIGIIVLFSAVIVMISFFTDFEKTSEENSEEMVVRASNSEIEDMEQKLHFNLGINTETLDFINNNYQEISEANQTKIGKTIEKSSINIQFFDVEKASENSLLEDDFDVYSTKTKGVIKTTEGNFNFEGSGDLYRVALSNNEIIYSSHLSGSFKNKKAEEEFTISMRYNPSTEQIDINFVSGVLGDSAILPFGKAFLTESQAIEIEEIIRK